MFAVCSKESDDDDEPRATATEPPILSEVNQRDFSMTFFICTPLTLCSTRLLLTCPLLPSSISLSPWFYSTLLKSSIIRTFYFRGITKKSRRRNHEKRLCLRQTKTCRFQQRLMRRTTRTRTKAAFLPTARSPFFPERSIELERGARLWQTQGAL